MPTSIVLVAIFAAVALGVLALSSLLAGERKAADRLRDLDKAPQPLLDTRRKRKTTPLEMKRRKEELASRLLGPLSKVFSGGSKHEQLRERMLYAGLRSPAAMSIFLGVKAALGAALPLTVIMALLAQHVPPQKTIMITGLVAILGLRLPNLWLGSRMRARQRAIAAGLPDTLDLMVVCVESGLGLDAALNRISDELVSVYPEISEELVLVNLEMRAGASRADALRNLGMRTGVEDVKSLAARLVQSDRFGTSIARSLRTHADTLRNRRRQRAEEAAAKTTVKLLFPLVFFIFPALFVVLLGPAAIKVFQVLGASVTQ